MTNYNWREEKRIGCLKVSHHRVGDLEVHLRFDCKYLGGEDAQALDVACFVIPGGSRRHLESLSGYLLKIASTLEYTGDDTACWGDEDD